MEQLNLITVRESAARELTASGAKLVVRISGQSFFTGTQAFKKAAEVASCIATLRECGLPEENIRLLDVSINVESGLLSRSSKAVYLLEVRCPSTDVLGPVLATVVSQKNANVAAVTWQYPDLPKTRQEVLREAVQSAKQTANLIAESLDVSLLGVHQLTYEITGVGQEVRIPVASDDDYDAVAFRRRAGSDALENLNLGHTARLVITVTAEFIPALHSNYKP